MTLLVNPFALRKAKLVYNFGLSECSRVKIKVHFPYCAQKQGHPSFCQKNISTLGFTRRLNECLTKDFVKMML